MSRHDMNLQRCDRCGAAARKRVTKPDTIFELLLCEHHNVENEPMLLAEGWRVEIIGEEAQREPANQ